MRKFTNEEVIAAYKETGSVWNAAKKLGMCGQSVWERLRRLGVPLSQRAWEETEIAEVCALASTHTISEIAQQVGRSYATVAGKISELGIGTRFGNRIRTKADTRKPIGEPRMRQYLDDLKSWDGSARQFCRHKGIRLERLVIEAQRYFPGEWEEYVRVHSHLPPKVCPQCLKEFIPMTGKQEMCSRKCASDWRVDHDYFGGRRSTAVGMSTKTCQLCGRVCEKKIGAHHVFGKENDPNHEAMVAICNGCHHIIGTLGGHPNCSDPEFWESLIIFVLARVHGHRKPAGFYASVEIEELSGDDVADDYEEAQATRQAVLPGLSAQEVA